MWCRQSLDWLAILKKQAGLGRVGGYLRDRGRWRENLLLTVSLALNSLATRHSLIVNVTALAQLFFFHSKLHMSESGRSHSHI
jgi:hypothetical protein